MAQKKRERARDQGSVRALGVEIDSALYERLDACRKVKQWTKRVFIEEALRRFMDAERQHAGGGA